MRKEPPPPTLILTECDPHVLRDVPPEMEVETSQYLTHAQERSRKRAEAVRTRRRTALAVAKKAADLLRTEFSVNKVILFGSAVQEELFHPRADVDLAVWGLSGDLYFSVVGQLQALDPEISIDLILFEEASESLQGTILEHGIVL